MGEATGTAERFPKALTKTGQRGGCFHGNLLPRMARVASSKPFQQPGTRSPGSASTLADTQNRF